MNRNVLKDELKKIGQKRKCAECGKNLRLFEGHCHPTMGSGYLVCRECCMKIEQSVERWRRFVLWNSFNPESSDPTFIDNYPLLKNNKKESYKKIKHQNHVNES
jgi:hypothetical protein